MFSGHNEILRELPPNAPSWLQAWVHNCKSLRIKTVE